MPDRIAASTGRLSGMPPSGAAHGSIAIAASSVDASAALNCGRIRGRHRRACRLLARSSRRAHRPVRAVAHGAVHAVREVGSQTRCRAACRESARRARCQAEPNDSKSKWASMHHRAESKTRACPRAWARPIATEARSPMAGRWRWIARRSIGTQPPCRRFRRRDTSIPHCTLGQSDHRHPRRWTMARSTRPSRMAQTSPCPGPRHPGRPPVVPAPRSWRRRRRYWRRVRRPSCAACRCRPAPAPRGSLRRGCVRHTPRRAQRRGYRR